MTTADELQSEQHHVDRAYARLDELRDDAAGRVRDALAINTAGGLASAKVDRDALVQTSLRREAGLKIGDQSLCFGRIDTHDSETFHIGRIGVSDDAGDPLVVDWRAPIAAAFYRATARDPLGITRRRHIRMRGRRVVAIDDELVGESALDDADLELVGEAALMASLSAARTGRMGDIVATIQGEQDRAIRSELAGVLVVQGGPGTGKTAVALHRAAYLLYAHQFPLTTQGVLVVGPNPVFCRYVENVLPGLGETGVRLATPGQLVTGVEVTAVDSPDVVAVKGDAAMVDRLVGAFAARRRRLDEPARVGFGRWYLDVSPDDSAAFIATAARLPTYRAGRRELERLVLKHLVRAAGEAARRSLDAGVGTTDPSRFDSRSAVDILRRSREVIDLVNRMWPKVTADDVVDGVLAELGLPARAARSEHDAALLDEAEVLLGPLSASSPAKAPPPVRTLDFALDRTLSELGLLPDCPSCEAELSMVDARWECDACGRQWKRSQVQTEEEGRRLDEAIARLTGTFAEAPDARPRTDTFGHAVVDEAQDLTPMQWRVLRRRVPGGSFTIVGDLGQAKYGRIVGTWDDIASHAAPDASARVLELTVNYRTPEEVMALAAQVLRSSRPDIVPPRSVRRSGVAPDSVAVAHAAELLGRAKQIADERSRLGGTVAIIVPPELAAPVSPDVLEASVVEIGVEDAKGLEFDYVVVVEPAMFDPGSLYVALTRCTSGLTFVHTDELPVVLQAAFG